MKKIPYGISNFEQLRRENYLYIDKTRYIELLEQDAPYQFFIRPRRFGKSLFLSMLDNYYDVMKKDRFEGLFGDLYIGENPTQYKNSYLVFRLSFAGLITSQGEERFIDSFDKTLIDEAGNFLKRYADRLGGEVLPESITGAETVIKYIVGVASRHNQRIFVLIDEYDNFANDLIGIGHKELYYELLSAEGYVRSFYKALKEGTVKSIARVFMTGVSPIMLDDLTSGFNITKNITMESSYNEMLGITKEELKGILAYYQVNTYLDIQSVIKDMEEYYNGYLFSGCHDIRVYNTNMALYFIDALNRYRRYPQSILDANIKTDYRKIENLAFHFKDEETITNLLTEGQIQSPLVDRFNLEYMYEKKENFISVLYYMGMLTIDKTMPNGYIFGIPNYVIRTIYWEYFLDRMKLKQRIDMRVDVLTQAVDNMAVNGEADKFRQYVTAFITTLSNRDLIRFDEKYIKMILMTLFYENGYYIPYSKYEVEGGYIDILLKKNKAFADYIKYEWMIELKYLKESERDRLEQVKQQGREQLQKYGRSEKMMKEFDRYYRKLLIVLVGKNDIYLECIG